MSFVTAVKQVTARAKNYSLDDLDIMTEVTNFTDDMIKDPPVSGVYVHGMFVQGAKWEDSNSDAPGFLTDMLPKELDPKLPVMNVFAIPAKEKNTVGYYECPVYYTTARGATYIFTAYLRMESEETDPIKWILAGVSLILSSDE
jgi:dynein heavy chain